MDPALVPVIQAAIAGTVAITVPAIAFRFALRQDRLRWWREQRALLYADLLAEAYAERQEFELLILDSEIRDQAMRHYVDTHLPPAERAKLGARGTALGSQEVNKLFNQLQSGMAQRSLVQVRDEGERIQHRMWVAGAVERLEAAIRREMGGDRSK